MLLIGLIGGLSWESTAEYYRIINRGAQARLGGVHSARSLIYSFDFGEIEALQKAGDWDAASALMVDAAQRLERGGADFLVICSNTMHRMAPMIEAGVKIPLLHIADPTGAAIVARKLTRIGLLGTAFTMEQPFYRSRLEANFGLEVLVPDDAGRAAVHRIIYEELVKGIVRDSSREIYRGVIRQLIDSGAEAIILGCTEIMLLVGDADSAVPLFDTTTLHAEAALGRALGTI
ncbi:MAG: aspartate/glutamate racemase family protein [Rhodospirillaceae bacterium]|nr:aspartate/glutamate racemase family protein [Rhodospirillaceae bacterium]